MSGKVTGFLVAALLALFGIGLVVLLVDEVDPAAYFEYVTPVVAVLLVLLQGANTQAKQAEVVAKQDVHTAQLATITRQTNGVLTSRIEEAVTSALANLTTTTTSADPAVADTHTTTDAPVENDTVPPQ